jgi:outer membrane protein assembly factor BamB
MNPQEILYVGVKGEVIAYEKATGRQLWTTILKSSQFVNVILDGEQVFAHTSGELFALDARSGRLLWKDELKGYGYGMATLVTTAAPNNSQAIRAEHLFEEQRNHSQNSAATSGNGH